MKEYICKGKLEKKTGFASVIVKQELIRCRNCKYYYEIGEVRVCEHEDGVVEPKPAGYCNYGERRTRRRYDA